jgi:Na+-driven multidrug efflux pump
MPFGDDIVLLLAGSDLPIESVGNAHLYILINCVFSFLLVAIVVLKNVLQALERGILPLISGFVEIVGRMGTAVLVMSLTAALTVDYDTGYNILCFSNPSAWVVGLIVVIPGFIGSVLKLRRLARLEDKGALPDLK